MSAFQAPYKAVLVSLYEYAIQSENKVLGNRIKAVFDLEFKDDQIDKIKTVGDIVSFIEDKGVC